MTALYNEGSITDSNGDTVSIVGNNGTVYVQGDSPYTVTVDGYGESADFSGAGTLTDWSDYEVSFE